MSELNGDTILKGLHDAGIPAYAEQTGGGTATLYIGNTHKDENGDDRWQLCAGPGSFDGPGWINPRFDTVEFNIGPDDDGESDSLYVPEDWDEDRCVKEMLRILVADHMTVRHGGQFELDHDALLVQITPDSLQKMHAVLHQEMPQDHDQATEWL